MAQPSPATPLAMAPGIGEWEHKEVGMRTFAIISLLSMLTIISFAIVLLGLAVTLVLQRFGH
jgi:hypothetical protein